MNRLAAYGSDSDESDSEGNNLVVRTAAPRPQPVRTVPLPTKVTVPPPKEIGNFQHSHSYPSDSIFSAAEPSLNLPKASNVDNQVRVSRDKEEELDTTVLRKDWEIKLAEKEKKEFKKTKKRIDAFGGLSKAVLNSTENPDNFQQVRSFGKARPFFQQPLSSFHNASVV